MNANDQLPVFVVEGSNWKCEVGLDEDDILFDISEQVVEAATKAIEVFKGVSECSSFQVTNNEDSPYVGITLLVYPKDSNSDKEGKFVYSYIIFANAGFYIDSIISLKALAKEAERLKHENDLKNFDKIKQKINLKKKGSKKPNPKKRKDSS